jgi:iron complex outermembrane receptor protein
MLEHSTLWGFDYFVIDDQTDGSCCSAFPEGANFNIFNPTYLSSRPDFVFTPSADFTQDWYGLYFQDQIKFPFNVYGNVGVRYDNAASKNNMTGVASTDDHVSPRGGLLWKPLQWLSVYGSYSENFGVSNSIWNAPGQSMLPPQTTEQWELGAKTEFFDGRLTASYAYFDLTKQNIAVSNPNNPLLMIASGEQESRGHELEMAGEILPGWRAVAAYTHLTYANINVGYNGGVDDDTGNRLYNTPRNFGSFWNTYEFQDASLRGLKLGGGVVAASQSQGTNANDFQLPGYVTLNLMTSYNMKVAGKNVTLQLNANNLLDKTYYSGTNTGSMIGVAAPRTFLGSIKLEF